VAWRRIPAGAFWMGCVPGDACNRAELPRLQVRIDKPFDMMEREVAAGEFQAFAAATGRRMPRQPVWYADATHPVVNLTWDEAREYCEWVGGSLPTEEQWEYAARGRLEGRLFPWGDEFRGEANARHALPTETWRYTAPVGSFVANGFGLYDMAGNVWEWTASLHRPTHDRDPATDGYELRTIKGGAWDSLPRRVHVSERAGLSRRGRHNLYVGFRCVR
jgi:formylglycine-generating enzyme required for sulfatase activity